MPSLLALLLLLPAAFGGEVPLDLRMAETYLGEGYDRMAAEQFRTVLRERPRSGRAQLGLARSLAGMGDCDGAMETLDGLRSRPVWGAEAAMTEAGCALREGDLSRAAVAFDEAVWYAPRRPQGWMNVAFIAAARGDEARLQEALDALLLLPEGEVLVALIQAQLALEEGGDAFEVRLADLRRHVEGTSGSYYHLLDARRWLDLDDPFTADAVLLEVIRRDMTNVQLALWRSEAARRRGDTFEARTAVNRPLVASQMHGPLALAIQARLLVDEGELDEAEAVLGQHPDPLDPEALASSWYIARARGETARAEALAAAWRQIVEAPDRRLEQLIPINAREVP